MVAFPNPPIVDIDDRDHLGTIWEAARTAQVKPHTIRVWVCRGKIQPVNLGDDGPELYHLPTVLRASQVKPGRPRSADPPTPRRDREPAAA
jgi:hypothetical protein